MAQYNIEEIKEKFAKRIIAKLQEIDGDLKEYNENLSYFLDIDGDGWKSFTINEGNIVKYSLSYEGDELYINKVKYDANFGKNKYLTKDRLGMYVQYLIDKVREYSFVQNFNKEFKTTDRDKLARRFFYDESEVKSDSNSAQSNEKPKETSDNTAPDNNVKEKQEKKSEPPKKTKTVNQNSKTENKDSV